MSDRCNCGHDITEHNDGEGKCYGTHFTPQHIGDRIGFTDDRHSCLCQAFEPESDDDQPNAVRVQFDWLNHEPANEDEPKRNERRCISCHLVHAGECW